MFVDLAWQTTDTHRPSLSTRTSIKKPAHCIALCVATGHHTGAGTCDLATNPNLSLLLAVPCYHFVSSLLAHTQHSLLPCLSLHISSLTYSTSGGSHLSTSALAICIFWLSPFLFSCLSLVVIHLDSALHHARDTRVHFMRFPQVWPNPWHSDTFHGHTVGCLLSGVKARLPTSIDTNLLVHYFQFGFFHFPFCSFLLGVS